MTDYTIKQGDAYALPVALTVDGETLTAQKLDTVACAEFMLGEDVRKVYPEDVAFDAENDLFLVPVTQAETFALDENSSIALDVRVEFSDGVVVGTKNMLKIRVIDALSEVEL